MWHRYALSKKRVIYSHSIPPYFFMHNKLPSILRLLRMRAGLTGREFAPRMRKCSSWVSKIESGAICITAVDFFLWLSAAGATITDALQVMREEGISINGFSSESDMRLMAGHAFSTEDLISQLRPLAQICQQKHIGLSILPSGEFKIRHKGC